MSSITINFSFIICEFINFLPLSPATSSLVVVLSTLFFISKLFFKLWRQNQFLEDFGIYIYKMNNFSQEPIYLKRQLTSFFESLNCVNDFAPFYAHRRNKRSGTYKCACWWMSAQKRLERSFL